MTQPGLDDPPLDLVQGPKPKSDGGCAMMGSVKQRIVTVIRVKSGEEPIDRSWLDRTAEERMMAVWELTLECLAWLPEKHEPRLQRSVVRVLRKGR